jgi:hypothetical protein
MMQSRTRDHLAQTSLARTMHWIGKNHDSLPCACLSAWPDRDRALSGIISKSSSQHLCRPELPCASEDAKKESRLTISIALSLRRSNGESGPSPQNIQSAEIARGFAIGSPKACEIACSGSGTELAKLKTELSV